jgi:hypothetical protein
LVSPVVAMIPSLRLVAFKEIKFDRFKLDRARQSALI